MPVVFVRRPAPRQPPSYRPPVSTPGQLLQRETIIWPATFAPDWKRSYHHSSLPPNCRSKTAGEQNRAEPSSERSRPLTCGFSELGAATDATKTTFQRLYNHRGSYRVSARRIGTLGKRIV